jgi:hypothetical protein
VNEGRTIFAQLMIFLPDRKFRRCVARRGADSRPRSFSCWDQYLAMAFAQLTERDSPRDIEACLRWVASSTNEFEAAAGKGELVFIFGKIAEGTAG